MNNLTTLTSSTYYVTGDIAFWSNLRVTFWTPSIGILFRFHWIIMSSIIQEQLYSLINIVPLVVLLHCHRMMNTTVAAALITTSNTPTTPTAKDWQHISWMILSTWVKYQLLYLPIYILLVSPCRVRSATSVEIVTVPFLVGVVAVVWPAASHTTCRVWFAIACHESIITRLWYSSS